MFDQSHLRCKSSSHCEEMNFESDTRWGGCCEKGVSGYLLLYGSMSLLVLCWLCGLGMANRSCAAKSLSLRRRWWTGTYGAPMCPKALRWLCVPLHITQHRGQPYSSNTSVCYSWCNTMTSYVRTFWQSPDPWQSWIVWLILSSSMPSNNLWLILSSTYA